MAFLNALDGLSYRNVCSPRFDKIYFYVSLVLAMCFSVHLINF